jgi:hypothetical protein
MQAVAHDQVDPMVNVNMPMRPLIRRANLIVMFIATRC